MLMAMSAMSAVYAEIANGEFLPNSTGFVTLLTTQRTAVDLTCRILQN